jgi:LysR family transcriptional regulator, hydrogen peroxide-inducible genes activator
LNLSALTIQQLRYVVAVDRYRTFGDAARASGVSQPALSAQIKKVETVLGVAIFDRERLPVVVTERGSLVVMQAHKVLEQFDRLGAIGSGEELTGTYRLGLIPSIIPTLLPLFLPRIARSQPKLELEIHEIKTDDLVRRLREGSLDGGVAATPLDIPGLHERVIYHEALEVYLSPGHPLAAQDRVRQSDLFDELVWLLSEGHCFRNQVLHLCNVRFARCGRPIVNFDAESFETLVRLVDAKLGVTVLPELVSRGLSRRRRDAQLRPFVPPEPVREISYLVGREHVRRVASEAVFRVLRASVPAGLRGRRPREAVIRPTAQA